jgi:hypothetical protein
VVHLGLSLRVYPNNTPKYIKMLRSSKSIFLRLPDVVFELPALTVSVGHTDHDGASPSQGKEPTKGDGIQGHSSKVFGYK